MLIVICALHFEDLRGLSVLFFGRHDATKVGILGSNKKTLQQFWGTKDLENLWELHKQDDWGAENIPKIIKIISIRELYKDWYNPE